MPGGKIDASLPFRSLGVAVLTVSDTRDAESDTSGALLAERVVSAGHELRARAMVRDDTAAIQAQVRKWIGDPDDRCRDHDWGDRSHRSRRDTGSPPRAV
jgi:molybdenum cofactor biosynthesis protein B